MFCKKNESSDLVFIMECDLVNGNLYACETWKVTQQNKQQNVSLRESLLALAS
jgi:hypothetical protein